MLRRGLVTWVSRLALALVVVCCCLSLLYTLACSPWSDEGQALQPRASGPTGKQGFQALLQEREEQHRQYANSLKKQISQLKEALQERSEQLRSMQDSRERAAAASPAGLLDGTSEWSRADLQEFFRSQLNRAEVHQGTKLPSEYAVVPFESFTPQKVYQLEMGLTRHPEERPVRKDRRDELGETIEVALQVLNSPREGGNLLQHKAYSTADFVEGLWNVTVLFSIIVNIILMTETIICPGPLGRKGLQLAVVIIQLYIAPPPPFMLYMPFFN